MRTEKSVDGRTIQYELKYEKKIIGNKYLEPIVCVIVAALMPGIGIGGALANLFMGQVITALEVSLACLVMTPLLSGPILLVAFMFWPKIPKHILITSDKITFHQKTSYALTNLKRTVLFSNLKSARYKEDADAIIFFPKIGKPHKMDTETIDEEELEKILVILRSKIPKFEEDLHIRKIGSKKVNNRSPKKELKESMGPRPLTEKEKKFIYKHQIHRLRAMTKVFLWIAGISAAITVLLVLAIIIFGLTVYESEAHAMYALFGFSLVAMAPLAVALCLPLGLVTRGMWKKWTKDLEGGIVTVSKGKVKKVNDMAQHFTGKQKYDEKWHGPRYSIEIGDFHYTLDGSHDISFSKGQIVSMERMTSGKTFSIDGVPVVASWSTKVR